MSELKRRFVSPRQRLSDARYPCAHFHTSAGTRAQTGGLAQSGSAIRALPGEAGAAAPKVSVRRRRLIDRPAQIQRLDNCFRRERKVLPNQRGDALLRNALG